MDGSVDQFGWTQIVGPAFDLEVFDPRFDSDVYVERLGIPGQLIIIGNEDHSGIDDNKDRRNQKGVP